LELTSELEGGIVQCFLIPAVIDAGNTLAERELPIWRRKQWRSHAKE
jgi:hypothetical protein